MQPNTKPLELTVSNFGPIAEANIELRPMSVFVGPSNTGKSYTAALIYALHRFFNAYSYWYWQDMNLNLSNKDVATTLAWVRETNSNLQRAKREQSSLIELPESIDALVRSLLIRNIKHSGDVLESELVRCFGMDKSKDLIRHSSDSHTLFSLWRNFSESGRNDLFRYNVELTNSGTEITASIPNNVELTNSGTKIAASIPNTLSRQIRVDSTLSPEDWINKSELDEERVAEALLIEFANAVVSNMAASLSHPAYYLPADRAGVMHAHQVAVRGLIASASRTGLRRDSPMPVLSGVLGDFLEQLVELAEPWHRRHKSDNDLALRLEQALLKGTVRVEQSQINYPSFVYRPDGWKQDLPLMSASSMVSELAPVVLYLRHVVQPGDLLIIEEPESHLHPAMQVEFTRQLAVAVQAGVRILITTHSEWVLEELANLVRLSELPKERRTGIDDEDVVLSPDQVGAWFFEPNSEGNGPTVREIALDTESATFPAGFGLVTESLYNRWSEISTRIEEG